MNIPVIISCDTVFVVVKKLPLMIEKSIFYETPCVFSLMVENPLKNKDDYCSSKKVEVSSVAFHL